jgi:acyl-coenzyme A synthetase/AMP-(fatty) acid ligase
VWEFFWPLMTGARLVLARPGAHGDAAYLGQLIQRAGVTTLHFVPSMLQAFLDAGAAAPCGSLRRVICSGEALGYELMERAMDALPSAGIHNLYGPTEAAVDVTYWAAERRERRIVPIGRPVANTRILVLDGALGPVPAGVAGELYIGGVQVGRGYLGRPATTAERFVPDPFAAEAGARMYRTGDRARWTADGEVEYLGRADFQVKVRGFRIELGEIEARLLEHPAVHAAVVVARADASGGTRLVAYCVADGGVEVEALRAHLSARLPEHMVPAAYVRLDALPLSPNGKLDRGALPAPADDAYARHGYEAPVGETEQALAEIWAEMLGLERVGRRDDFFDLGGHSLLAARVASRAGERFGAHVSATAVFLHPTLAALAQAVDEARASRSAPPAAYDGLLDGGAGTAAFSVDMLSDDDVDAMLAALLSRGTGP